MTIDKLIERIAEVLQRSGDPEVAHWLEDEIMRDWIENHATADEWMQFERMRDIDFPRWYA